MKIEGKRIRSLKFIEKINEIDKTKIGVVLDEKQLPQELKEKKQVNLDQA